MKSKSTAQSMYSPASFLLLLATLMQVFSAPTWAENSGIEASTEAAHARAQTESSQPERDVAGTTEDISCPSPAEAESSNGAATHIDVQSSSQAQSAQAPLQGSISKNERSKSSQRSVYQLQASGNMNDWLSKMIGSFTNMPGTTIQLNGNIDLRTLLQRRAQQSLMSSEDFRKLEYGVLGLAAMKWVGGVACTVRQVLPDCPAALAGIRPGDILVQAGQHVFTKEDDQSVYWQMIAGKAGTPVDLVIKRDDKSSTFHLIRMNIEDIRNDTIRQLYEMKLSALGPPTNGETPELRSP